MIITREIATKVRDTVDAGLVAGVGVPKRGEMCVEAAVCFALGLPHSDNPPCVHSSIRALKIALNDANWSSNAARTKGMRKLAILQLGTDTGFDGKEFIKRLIPLTLEVAERVQPTPHPSYWDQVQDACGLVLKALNGDGDLNAAANAANAAANAAAYAAANAAAYAAASAAYAANAAAYAADLAAASAAYAANAAANAAGDGDQVLTDFAESVAQILIDMKVPGVEWLDLL